MTSIIARATIIVELGAEDGRDGIVFNEVGVLSVGIVGRERSGCYVLSDPSGISGAAIEDGNRREGGMEVVDRAGEAILEEAVGVNRGGYVL